MNMEDILIHGLIGSFILLILAAAVLLICVCVNPERMNTSHRIGDNNIELTMQN